MKKNLKRILFLFGFFVFVLIAFLFIGKNKPAEKIIWGANFSQKHAEYLGLDWKSVYSALLDDLGIRNLKIAAQWDLVEPIKDEYDFEDLDWQINEAGSRQAKILLVIGMKAPRWPECHIPLWAGGLDKKEQQERILKLIEKIVLRYKDSPIIESWQVENEPFFPFGVCPWVDKRFLKEEINLVKSLDLLKRPVVISDSGEGSFWINAAKFGDIVGTTMYKKAWFRQLGMYIYYPFPPTFYARKALIIKKIFKKEVICVEFQAEPWGPTLLYDSPLEEQEKTMSLERFQKNIEFARKTGFERFYLWGAEWWFWMKEKQDKPEIWNEAKELWK